MTAGNAYTKAVDASMDTIGTGLGRVMVLLPTLMVDNTGHKYIGVYSANSK
jgi:hypothetical protein